MYKENIMEDAILEALKRLIDPGAGLDVWRMGLVRDLQVDPKSGHVSLTFRPSSPVCPVAFTLAPAIREAICSVPGITSVSMKIQGFNRAKELETVLADAYAPKVEKKTT